MYTFSCIPNLSYRFLFLCTKPIDSTQAFSHCYMTRKLCSSAQYTQTVNTTSDMKLAWQVSPSTRMQGSFVPLHVWTTADGDCSLCWQQPLPCNLTTMRSALFFGGSVILWWLLWLYRLPFPEQGPDRTPHLRSLNIGWCSVAILTCLSIPHVCCKVLLEFDYVGWVMLTDLHYPC